MNQQTDRGSGGSDRPHDALFDPYAYWDERHALQEELTSGGHIALGEPGNELFYRQRLGTLIEITGDQASFRHPLEVLDAGCGKGFFSDALMKGGHRVTGIDASSVAIEHCRQHAEGVYVQSGLEEYTSAVLYDVVYCIDVAFHILDDGLWEKSMDNLASLVRCGGRLILTEADVEEREPRGAYVVHRPLANYDSLLEPQGFRFVEFRPYRFRENEVGFLLYDRVH